MQRRFFIHTRDAGTNQRLLAVAKKKSTFIIKGNNTKTDGWLQFYLGRFEIGCTREEIDGTSLRVIYEWINQKNEQAIEQEKANKKNGKR